MAREIERKFLVTPGFPMEANGGTRMCQGYINADPERTVRVRVAGPMAWLTIKGASTDGVSRAEFEYEIPVLDAEQLLGTLCIGPRINKVRHRYQVGKHTWEIDVFEGDNAGLVVAEIELDSVHETFEKPPWLDREVTGDRRFYNSQLAQNPYCGWPGPA